MAPTLAISGPQLMSLLLLQSDSKTVKRLQLFHHLCRKTWPISSDNISIIQSFINSPSLISPPAPPLPSPPLPSPPLPLHSSQTINLSDSSEGSTSQSYTTQPAPGLIPLRKKTVSLVNTYLTDKLHTHSTVQAKPDLSLITLTVTPKTSFT